MSHPDIDNHDFDDKARATHARALVQVSAGTMAQLHRRRYAALENGRTTARKPGWPLAAAFASLCVVAIGLGLGLHHGGMQATPDTAFADLDPAALASGVELEDALASFEQTPDFYLWLASSDANLLAME